MARKLRIHGDFAADLRSQVTWLREHRDEGTVNRLRAGIDEALHLIAELPGVGGVEGRRETRVMRRLILRRLPFLVWYTYDEAAADQEIWVLRLFHVRQDRRRRR